MHIWMNALFVEIFMKDSLNDSLNSNDVTDMMDQIRFLQHIAEKRRTKNILFILSFSK